mmetsp:Transcript_23384/g.57958  ORF Transcript_23384/g.57958 Transcript_23384/m.57958 type:complete len:258 (-) Transcript_23384:274-1047(-)
MGCPRLPPLARGYLRRHRSHGAARVTGGDGGRRGTPAPGVRARRGDGALGHVPRARAVPHARGCAPGVAFGNTSGARPLGALRRALRRPRRAGGGARRRRGGLRDHENGGRKPHTQRPAERPRPTRSGQGDRPRADGAPTTAAATGRPGPSGGRRVVAGSAARTRGHALSSERGVHADDGVGRTRVAPQHHVPAATRPAVAGVHGRSSVAAIGGESVERRGVGVGAEHVGHGKEARERCYNTAADVHVSGDGAETSK